MLQAIKLDLKLKKCSISDKINKRDFLSKQNTDVSDLTKVNHG